MGFELEARNTDSKRVAFSRFPTDVRRGLTAGFRDLGKALRDDLRPTIVKRSGKARRAVRVAMERSSGKADVAVRVYWAGSSARHGPVLERGATLQPKVASKLTVPIGRARTKQGQARFKAKDLRDNPTAFGYERSFVRNDVVLGVRGDDLEALFKLRSSIVFPRRSYFKKFRQAHEARIKRDVEAILDRVIDQWRRQHLGTLQRAIG